MNYYIFNPYHELALANNDENYLPKQSAAKFAEDCALLPIWFNENCTAACRCRLDSQSEWKNITKNFGLKYFLVDTINFSEIKNIQAWGWNKSVCKNLISKGIDKNILPNKEKLQRISELSHRKTAAEALNFLKKSVKIDVEPAVELKTLVEIEVFAENFDETALKSPYSSSGKGVYFARKELSNSVLGWCKRTLKSQGCVLAEKRYNVVQNFAMEFKVTDNQANFVGYSLFETNGKTYTKNILLPDSEIENILAKFISKELLNAVKQALIEFIKQKIVPDYNGFLGVDMFVYEENNRFFLNPCVEINLRATMGLVAHEFYKNFVKNGKKGVFAVDFFKNSADLIFNHQKCAQNSSPKFANHRLSSGYISLCPIFENTQYRIFVEIEKK
ncbi:MAG: hypothetical protein LBS50_06640 [Prevotellaceae bacterium]|jgi:hypothetical protein|nr:hypothetical protein [Prevotellaceae bacterium]